MQQQKFITSHAERVKRAQRLIDQMPERISIFDREAFVEFFLLEDIERLYRYRYQKVESRKPITPEGIFAQKKQLEKMHYLIYMLVKCIEIMHGKLDEGAYSDVWKAIPEHQLKMTANNFKYLDRLIEITEDMLNDVSKEALALARKMKEQDEFMNDLEIHDANARSYYNISEFDGEIAEIISSNAVDANTKNKPNLN